MTDGGPTDESAGADPTGSPDDQTRLADHLPDDGSEGVSGGGNRTDDPADGAPARPTGDPTDDASRRTPDALAADEKVELALDLLAHLEREELSLAETMDRIETVTTNPTLTRRILDEAELRGIVERKGGRILTRRGGTFVRFESQVVTREGEFDCRRCGAGITTGHFVRFESGELGPFGSSCVRKVTGRE